MGRFHQGSEDVVGLTIDMERLEKDAYCGRLGDCSGKIDLHVRAHKPTEGLMLECGLEVAKKGSSIEVDVCRSNLTDVEANCTIQMPGTISAGEKVDGFCRLVEGGDRKPVTKDAPFQIHNHHEAAAKVEQDEDEEEPEKKKTEAVKSNTVVRLCFSWVTAIAALVFGMHNF